MEDYTNVVYLDEYRKRKLSKQFDGVRKDVWHPSMGDKSPQEYWAEKEGKENDPK